MASFTPYGYKRVKVWDGGKERPKLEPNPHEAPVVARMFKQVLEGEGLKAIVKNLNKESIASPRGKGWGKTTVYRVLTNEVYTGTLIWGKYSGRALAPIRVENAWPAIIDLNTFHIVQKKMASKNPRVAHPRTVPSFYLLSGLLFCSCGRAMIGHSAKSHSHFYYLCSRSFKQGKDACDA